MEIQLKKKQTPSESPEDSEFGRLTQAEIMAEIERIENKPAGTLTVREKLRLHRLKKFGLKCKNITHVKPQKTKKELAAKLDTATTSEEINRSTKTETPTPQQDIKNLIITSYLNTLDIIQTLKDLNINKIDFINDILTDPNFSQKLQKARETVADSYIHKILILNEELKSGYIDACTHSNLCNVFKWLASNLNILYNDKAKEKTAPENITNNTLVIDADKVKSLNNLLK